MKTTLHCRAGLHLLACLAFAALPSCKKGGGSAEAKTDNLTGVTWRVRTVEFQQADGSWKDEPGEVTAAAFVFGADNTFTVSHDNRTETGGWHFASGTSQIVLSGNAFDGTYAVTQLTSSTLQWTITDPPFWGTTKPVRETLGH
jgi:hypothetical protein